MTKNIDTFIKNALIFDGAGSVPFAGDIGVSGDKVAFIDKTSEAAGTDRNLSRRNQYEDRAEHIIDAEGMAVSPGYIDAHAHSEFMLLADPRAEGKVYQGVTTEINGNCGLSAAPLYGDALQQRESDLKEYDITERWSTFKEYFTLLKKRGIALNFVTLTGHGNIRASVLGYENRTPSRGEMQRMRGLLQEAVDEGAAGMSTGLIYPPGVYSTPEELIDLLRPLSSSARSPEFICTSHMRSEGDKLAEAVEELIAIGKKTGMKVHISHIKTSGEKNWHKIDRVISMIENARKKGIQITCDRYPYTASSTDLDTVIPSWAYEGGAEEELKRLKSPSVRKKIEKEILHEHSEQDYWKNVYVTAVASGKNRWMEGKSIAFIANREGSGPVDALIRILIEEKLRVGAIFSSMSEDNLRRFLSLPYAMIGTDSSARSFSGITCKGKPHPRGFGSFPRFVGRYVREIGLMTMSEAIHKMTSLPARTFGIQKRGVLKRGAFADIVVFDPHKISDTATFDQPFLKPEGIYYVFVNGIPALREGRLTNAKAGRILRHGI
jgi:N-acyl-D-aspartate/D-glutamate deacylase